MDTTHKKISTALRALPASSIGLVIIDKGAVKRNYNKFKSILFPTTVAPVLKANAYGLGLIEIATTLYEEGASEFFVATIDEGIDLKKHIPSVNVFVLYGLFHGVEEIYYENNIIPVLNSYDQVMKWQNFAKHKKERLDCIIHFDTGMSRTGTTVKDAQKIIDNKSALTHINILYLMSHLCSSEDVKNPLNEKQRLLFENLSHHFPNTKTSLTASPILYMGDIFKKDMARIGYSLYGFLKNKTDVKLEQSFHVYSRIIQIRDSLPGDTVGYDATYVVKDAGRLATISIGYADGYQRFLHNYKPYVYIEGYKAYIVGKISMDFCVVDVSDIPENLIYEGAWVQMIGDDIRVSELVANSTLIPHEIPIHIGKRYQRQYFD